MDAQSFTLFPHLPKEIREQIWTHTLPGSRFIAPPLSIGCEAYQKRDPVALQVNYESRQVVLKHYTKRDKAGPSDHKYVDFNIDTFQLEVTCSYNPTYGYLYERYLNEMMPSSDQLKITSLQLVFRGNMGVSHALAQWIDNGWLSRFPRLKDLQFAWLPDGKGVPRLPARSYTPDLVISQQKGLERGEASLRNFVAKQNGKGIVWELPELTSWVFLGVEWWPWSLRLCEKCFFGCYFGLMRASIPRRCCLSFSSFLSVLLGSFCPGDKGGRRKRFYCSSSSLRDYFGIGALRGVCTFLPSYRVQSDPAVWARMIICGPSSASGWGKIMHIGFEIGAECC